MKILLDCKHASRLLSQAQDVALPMNERVRLWLHLRLCNACTLFAAQLRLMREFMRLSRQ